MVSFTVCEFHLIFRCVVSQHLPAKDSHTCQTVYQKCSPYSSQYSPFHQTPRLNPSWVWAITTQSRSTDSYFPVTDKADSQT